MKRMKEIGVKVLCDTRAVGLSDKGVLQTDGNDGESRIKNDKVLVTVGRKPVTEGWGREELVLEMEGPYLRIDQHCQTAMRGIYAIGDVTGDPMLAHRAMAQDDLVARIVAGQKLEWDKQAISAVCFTDPEVVTVGLSPDQAATPDARSRQTFFPLAPMAAR